jgi:hypothetical protein
LRGEVFLRGGVGEVPREASHPETPTGQFSTPRRTEDDPRLLAEDFHSRTVEGTKELTDGVDHFTATSLPRCVTDRFYFFFVIFLFGFRRFDPGVGSGQGDPPRRAFSRLRQIGVRCQFGAPDQVGVQRGGAGAGQERRGGDRVPRDQRPALL